MQRTHNRSTAHGSWVLSHPGAINSTYSPILPKPPFLYFIFIHFYFNIFLCAACTRALSLAPPAFSTRQASRSSVEAYSSQQGLIGERYLCGLDNLDNRPSMIARTPRLLHHKHMLLCR